MYKKILLFAFSVLILLPSLSFSEIKAHFDLAQFRYNDKQAHIELNYLIPVYGLEFITAGDSLQAQVKVEVEVLKDSVRIKSDAWRLAKSVLDSGMVDSGLNMLDKIDFLFEPGFYSIILSVDDLNNDKNSFTGRRDFQIVPFLKQKTVLSSIVLASIIKKNNAGSPGTHKFIKQGFEITPKPSGIFTFEAPMLFYYTEVYNLNSLKGNQYKTQCRVLDINEQPLGAVKPRQQIKQIVEASVEVGAINISVLPTGLYALEISVLDEQDTFVASSSKRFKVFNPEVEQSVQTLFDNIEAAVAASSFAFMTEKELDDDWAITGYIATQDEQKAYADLETIDEKREYLYQFWAERDPSVMTMDNEYREVYMQKIRYANEHYRCFIRAGWKTDRGRVYILYGLPDDVERFPNNPNTYSYEIWRYDDVEGGVEFVFADIQEYGDFMQLHSTKRGEPSNHNWQQHILR